MNVYLDGSVLLYHGGVESGQGLHTKMIQVEFLFFVKSQIRKTFVKEEGKQFGSV